MNKKKPLSVLAALILALSIITTISTGVSAASVDLAAVANSARLSFTDINGNEYVWEEDLSAKPEIVSVITEIHNVSGELVLPTYLTGYADDVCMDGGNQFYFADSAFDTVNKNIPITSINFSQMYDSFGFDRFMDDIDHFMDVCPSLQTVIGLDDTYVKKDGAFQNNEFVWEHEPSEGSYVCVITEVHNVTDALVLPKYLGSYEYYFAYDAFSTVDSDHPINLIDFSQMYGSFCFDRFMDNIDHFMDVCPALQTIIGPDGSYIMKDGVIQTADNTNIDERLIYTDVNGNEFVWGYDLSESPSIVSAITEIHNVSGELVLPKYLMDDDGTRDGGDRFYFTKGAFATVDSDHPITSIDFSQMYGSFGFDRFMDDIDHFMDVCPSLQTVIGPDATYVKQDGAFCPITHPAIEPKRGDIDGDGNITILDVTFIQRKLAEIPLTIEFNDEIADVDGDKIVTILDATLIQRWLVGFKINSHVGETILA